MYATCRRRLLTTEIQHKRKHLRCTQEKLKLSKEQLRSIYSWFEFNHIIAFITSVNTKSMKRVEIVQNRKLDNLKQEYLATGIDPDKVIFNYSDYTLNPMEKKVLSRGLRFSIRPDKLDYCDFLTPFEKLARDLKNRPIAQDELNFDYVKTRLKSIALASYYGYDFGQFPLNISKAELTALKNLSKNRDLVILRPDKGNGVVILNKVYYIQKVETILSDTSKFKKLDCDMLDLCAKRENKLIRFLRDKLLKDKAISESVHREILSTGSTPGVLYGLPKVHKENCPARPILSAIGTYNYKLAKFLVPILKPFTSNEYTVKDSFSFCI